MKKSYLGLIFLFVLANCFMLGCKKGGLEGLVPAEGVVLFNGSPIAGALITFSPKSTVGDVVGATALTDEKGRFKMMTLSPGDGVYPAEYYVTVSKIVIEGGLSREEDWARQNDKNAMRENADVPEKTITYLLPRQYEDINSSGLEVVIPEKGKKDITLTLEGEIDDTPQAITGPGR